MSTHYESELRRAVGRPEPGKSKRSADNRAELTEGSAALRSWLIGRPAAGGFGSWCQPPVRFGLTPSEPRFEAIDGPDVEINAYPVALPTWLQQSSFAGRPAGQLHDHPKDNGGQKKTKHRCVHGLHKLKTIERTVRFVTGENVGQ